MPLLDKPFGWTWLLAIGWFGYRLLIAVLLAIHEAKSLGHKGPIPLFLFHLFGSAGVLALLAALGWRTIVGVQVPMLVICFGFIAGFFGFIGGIIVDLTIAAWQHRIAVRIVTGRAPAYAEQLEVGDPEQRIQAATALAFIESKALFAVPQLLEAWKDRDAELRYRVAIAFWAMDANDAEVVSAMQHGLSDSDARVRVAAASVLVHCGQADDTPVLPILRAGLKMEEEARDLAVQALMDLGPDAAPAIPDLVAMIGEDFNTNAMARSVLAEIGEPAVPALIPLLKLENPAVRGTAIDTLAEIGPDARAALPVLQELLAEDDKSIRLAVMSAIEKIAE